MTNKILGMAGILVMSAGVAAAQTSPPVTPVAPLVPIDQPATSMAPTQPVAPSVTATAVAAPMPPVAPVVATEKAAPDATAPVSDEKMLETMRKTLSEDFKNSLPFALTEDKMIAYIHAATKVEKINSRWDIEVAGAATDQMAIENNNFAVEDINAALKNMKGLTMDEYSAMTVLTAKDMNFARVVNVYKDLIKRGALKTLGEPEASPVAAVKAPAKAEVDPKEKERLDALETQVQNLRDSLKAPSTAPVAPAATGTDPVLAAQLEAMNANLDKIAEKVKTLDEISKTKKN